MRMNNYPNSRRIPVLKSITISQAKQYILNMDMLKNYQLDKGFDVSEAYPRPVKRIK